MQAALDRRSFLQQSLAAPLFIPAWQAAPPASYTAELARLMRAAPVPGAVIGALQDYKLSWLVPLGVRAEGSHDPITAASLFQAASLTKQVTAYAAFALRAQGELDLDRPLVSYVDDLPNPAARTVTARHVLSQSSGFPNWRFSEDSKALPDLVPEFTPGSRYQYSGEGFFYLQRVLEQVSGKRFWTAHSGSGLSTSWHDLFNACLGSRDACPYSPAAPTARRAA